MKELMAHVSDAVLSVLAVSLLMVFLFGTSQDGLLYRLDEGMPEIQQPYATTWNADKLYEVLSKEKPDIGLKEFRADGTKNVVLSQKAYVLTELFYATDSDGSELDVRIEAVYSLPDEQDLLSAQEVDSFKFTESGTYDVEISVTDKINRIWKKTVRIPVRRG